MLGKNQNQVKRTSNRRVDPNNTPFLYSNEEQNKIPVLNERGNGIGLSQKDQHGPIAKARASSFREIQGYNNDIPKFPLRTKAGGFGNKLFGPKYVKVVISNFYTYKVNFSIEKYTHNCGPSAIII